MGKGPGAGAGAEKLKKQQMKRAKEYQKAFKEQNFDLDDTDGMFIPQKKAKHRHPELADFGVEGTTQETKSNTWNKYGCRRKKHGFNRTKHGCKKKHGCNRNKHGC